MGTTPRVAALTMVRDEALMLPRWLAHYGRELGTEHLYVVDDNSTDGSTDAIEANVIPIPHWGSNDFERRRMTLVNGFAAGLLAAYDAVLFCDADEFLVADPARHGGLLDLVASKPGAEALGALALNVLHHRSREPALRAEEPVLGQRRLAMFMPLMCKPHIKRTPAAWAASSHGLTAPYEVHRDLFMFHLKFADATHLMAVGDHRQRLVKQEDRAPLTSWKAGGTELLTMLDDITAKVSDPDELDEFASPRRAIRTLVERGPNGVYHSRGRRQLRAMERQPVVRVPDRFLGIV